MTPHYHQTNLISPEQKDEYEKKAATQDMRILHYFEKNPGLHLSAEHIQNNLPLPKIEYLTSIRRSLTNLSNADRIVLVGQCDSPRSGRPINLYKYLF